MKTRGIVPTVEPGAIMKSPEERLDENTKSQPSWLGYRMDLKIRSPSPESPTTSKRNIAKLGEQTR